MRTGLRTWRRMIGYIKPYRYWAFFAFVGAVASNFLGIAIPVILQEVIDKGIALNDANFMAAAGIFVVFLGFLRGIAGFLTRYFGERQSLFIAYDMRNEIYDKVQALPSTYHDNAQVGTIVTRAISDVNEIQRYYAFGLLEDQERIRRESALAGTYKPVRHTKRATEEFRAIIDRTRRK
ncbi:MAG: ABC transporter transmembrane domain-containing protein [Anaerolineae bacterium]|nr:ABC transporter transmembrane domain-containing protein [Anaerolineae bacterium]MDQ7036142.1 ABC transporter transmembrane domain-containing protein [Anaerolineae bacterium]